MTTAPGSIRGSRNIPGYGMGAPSVARAPITLAQLDEIKQVLAWSQEDVEALRQLGTIAGPKADEIVGAWYAFAARTPAVLAAFSSDQGRVDEAYLAAVRARFVQWIHDTCDARHDQAWLDYQFEIGRRHHRVGKNRTDGADATSIVPFRYIIPLAAPIASTMREFIAREAPAADVERMMDAWGKAVLLQLALWSHPFVRDGDW